MNDDNTVSMARGCCDTDCENWATGDVTGFPHCPDHRDEARMMANAVAEAHDAVRRTPLEASPGQHLEVDFAWWEGGFHIYDTTPGGTRHWIGNVQTGEHDGEWQWQDHHHAATGDWMVVA